MTQDQHPADPPEGRRFALTRDFFKALHDAGLLPQYPMCSRVVIDCDINNGAVRMYVDQIPSGALLTIPALMTASAQSEAHVPPPGYDVVPMLDPVSS